MEKGNSKLLAIAKIVDPAAVSAALANANETAHDGAIFVEIPELGITTPYIYCRYGLSIPYYKVQIGEKLWVEPTIGESERWVYTGLADVGGATLPDEPLVLGTQLRNYITDLVGEINDEAIQKINDVVTDLNSFITTYNTHTHPVPGVLLGGPGTNTTPTTATGSSSTVSALDTTDATNDILSDVNFTKKS